MVATKVPPQKPAVARAARLHPDEAFPADWVVSCTERSLRNLGLDTIDVQQFHVWSLGVARSGRLARSDRAAEERRQDPLLRGVDQRSGVLRAPRARRVGPRRHRSGDLQHLRPEPRGRAPRRRSQPPCVGVVARVPFDEGASPAPSVPTPPFPRATSATTYFDGDRKTGGVASALRRSRPTCTSRRAAPGGRAALLHQRRGNQHGDPGHALGSQTSRRTQLPWCSGPLDPQQLDALRSHRWVRNYYASANDD